MRRCRGPYFNRTVLVGYEIIFLNGGSTDESLKIAKQFMKREFVSSPTEFTRGLAYHLNQGIELAHGKYIARIDSDDLCSPERFERHVGFLNARSGINILGCRSQCQPHASVIRIVHGIGRRLKFY